MTGGPWTPKGAQRNTNEHAPENNPPNIPSSTIIFPVMGPRTSGGPRAVPGTNFKVNIPTMPTLGKKEIPQTVNGTSRDKKRKELGEKAKKTPTTNKKIHLGNKKFKLDISDGRCKPSSSDATQLHRALRLRHLAAKLQTTRRKPPEFPYRHAT